MIALLTMTSDDNEMSTLCSRYALYTKTRLGYMYYKRQMKKARELYPAGHSTAQPLSFNGLQLWFIYLVPLFGLTAEMILVSGYLLPQLVLALPVIQ